MFPTVANNGLITLMVLILLINEAYAEGNPEYAKPVETGEVVFPRLIESRTTSGQLSLVVNKEIHLDLKPSTVFSDTVTVKTYEGKTPTRNWISGAKLNKKLFHDSNKMASVFVSQNGNLQVEGVLSATKAIKPLSTPVHKSRSGAMPHIIFNIRESATDPHDHRRRATNANLSSESEATFLVSERAENPAIQAQTKASSKTVYVEVYFIIDWKLQKTFITHAKVLAYLGASVNAVRNISNVMFILCALKTLNFHGFDRCAGLQSVFSY